MYQLIRTTLLQSILETATAFEEGRGLMLQPFEELASAMEQKPPVLEGYVFARIFNTTTHQVLVQRGFEEVVDDQEPEDDDEDATRPITYVTQYNVSLTCFHEGIKVEKTYGFTDEDEREKAWLNINQQAVEEFVRNVVDFINANK
jgi:hypothetical protein